MTKVFDYKQLDVEGMQILDVISSADQFNEWMYDAIKPHCKGNIIEIGSGIGNISQFFIRDNSSIFLSDIRENYCHILQSKFQSKNIIGIQQLDLVKDNFDVAYSHLIGKFDTLFALNVVEHIKDEDLAIANAYKLLRPSGHLILLVPAYQSLYNGFDKELGHYRRYTSSSLTALFSRNGIKVVGCRYFNAAGILGWFLSGKLMRNKTIPGEQMSLFNKLVPLFKWVDRILFRKVGLSVITVGQKTSFSN